MIQKFRRTAQVLSLALMALIPILNRQGINFIAGSFYSVSIGPVWITDPLIGVQAILSSLRIDVTLLLSLLVPILIAFALGRVFCSWICPQNTLSEAVDALARRLRIRRWSAPTSTTPRFAVLGSVLLLTVCFEVPVASMLSAPGIFSVQTAQLLLTGAIGFEAGLILLIVVGEFFFIRRGWCNCVCPVGTGLALFRLDKTLKVVLAEDENHACGHCSACVSACQLGLDPMIGKLYPQCHNCGSCISACGQKQGEHKPLTFRF